MKTSRLALALAMALAPAAHAESGYESVMGIVNTHRSVKLDPSVQHEPLAAELAQLRPPPPRVPASFDLFVGLSVFRDGYRCGKTIFTGFKRAKEPERLFFGVVDQVNAGDERCVDEYCVMAEAEWPDRGPCPYRDHIRVDEHTADDSRGPTLARHYQQKLIRGEEFCLQLDGHSIFTNNWDDNLLAEWTRVGNEMAVLTTYLHHIHDFVKENGDNSVPNSLPHLCTTMRGYNGCVRNVGASMISGSKFPQLSALWGAGLSFSKCHAERRAPVDPHTLWMFDGEEFLRASHLWTNGYDMYSPSELGSVVYHNYSKVPARFEHVKVDQEQKRIETEMGVNRFFLLVGKPFKGQVDALELDKYGFGKVRTFQEYLDFSGVTFEEGKNDTESCEQLHWVPYSNATEVEEIVGGGWKLYPALPNKEPATPQLLSDGDRHEPLEENQDEEEDPKKLHAAEAHAEAGANEDAEKESADLQAAQAAAAANGQKLFRQELGDARTGGQQAPGLGAGAWFLLLCVAAALFVTLSNDSTSRSIRRQFRMKATASSE